MSFSQLTRRYNIIGTSSHPGKTEGDKFYDVLDRKQLSTSMDSDTIHAEADINSYSKLELNDNNIKPEKNPALDDV